MLDTVRRYVEAGREALTPKKAEELARALAKQGQARADQVQQLARDLVDWSKKSSDRFRDTVRREVKKQLDKAGVATKDDVESLKGRLRKLESDTKTSAAKPATKTTAAKPPAAKTTAAKTTAAKPTATRKPPGRKPTTPPTIGGGGTPTA